MKKIFILFVLFSVFSLAFSQDSISENILDDFSVENTKIPEISNEEYAILYFKKINQTQTKLSYMNKKSSLAKIGTETINGDISGTLYYNVKVKGFGGVVTLRYTNYCDEEGWVFDGEIITKSNMAQNGTLEGVVTITGDHPGKAYYENAILKSGEPGDGTYGFEQEGCPREELDYHIFFKAKEN